MDQLIQFFLKFPGVGRRQAQRFVFHLLNRSNFEIDNFINQLKELRQNTKKCTHCFYIFTNISSEDNTLCETCRNPQTQQETMIIVEKNIDVENIKKAGVYEGRFFVLNGLLPVTTKQNIQDIQIEELIKEVKRAVEENNLNEIILGLSLNPEGEHTSEFVKTKLEPFVKNGLKISELGRGLSTGAELEYMDSNTLKNALGTRQ